ncbi:CHAT domain-containing protein [Acidobacteriota bacterium]
MKTRDYKEAFETALRSETISRTHLQLTASSLPERQALRCATDRKSRLDTVLSLSVRQTENLCNIPASAQRAWDALIRSRAMVLDEMAKRNHALAEANRLARIGQRFASASQRVANLMVRGPGNDTPERYRKMLEQAQKERETAEQALAESSSFFREGLAKKKLGVEDVVDSLPSGSAMVAFARYSHHALVGKKKTKEIRDSDHSSHSILTKDREISPSYMAFVLPSGKNEPIPILLGDADEIELLVSRWRTEARGGFMKSESAYRNVALRLREKVWDPVVRHLGEAKRVFVVPDGELNLVNFGSLPVAEPSYLVENGPLIHYLSTERDLVPVGMKELIGEGLLVLGDPAFDETSLFSSLRKKHKAKKKDSIAQKLADLLPFRGERSGCSDFQTIRINALPETAWEIMEIHDLWTKATASTKEAKQSLYLRGQKATEASFKAEAPGKRMIHLATHGFFLSGKCPTAQNTSRGVVGQVSMGENRVPPKVLENPLRLSGLALAGFNHREAAGPEEEDGVLTAEEIAALDLSGVQWAVLSACETGVGDIKAGEGVFGLRRAFQVAGVNTLIMSLWPVKDKPTREWMKALYEARLVQRKDTAECMRDACLTVLKQRREKGLSTHPLYWGGFVAAGDWN